MKFSIKDFFGKCDQTRRKLRTADDFLCDESSVNTLLDTFAWFKLKLLKKDKLAQETIVSNNELIFSKYRKYLSYGLEQFVRVEVFCLQHLTQGR